MLSSSVCNLRTKLLTFLCPQVQSYRSCYSINQKHLFNMNTVYFRHQSEDKKFQINFRYKNAGFGIDRYFNFVRSESEKIDICLQRIQTNVEKEICKKFRKSKKTLVKGGTRETEDTPKVSIKMVRNGDSVTQYELIDLISMESDLELYILDEPFIVACNMPWITLLTLPKSILATCYIYPPKLEMQCANPDETIFKWYKGKESTSKKDDNISWTEISSDPIYLVQTSDVGHKLKVVCTPKNESKTGPPMECISKCLVEAGPGICLFEPRHMLTKLRLPNDQFRVVSYNLLADLYADSDYSRSTLFPYCPPYALDIDYRKQLFIKEIFGYNADIICLQEVDSKVFDLDLQPFLKMSNYLGTFKAKGQTAEGLATIFHLHKFSLVHSYGITIGENIKTLDVFADLWQKIQNNENLVKRIVERSTAVQVTTIKSNESNKILVIANTHLYFHPDADHIRLLQIAFCMKYVEYVYHKTQTDLSLDNEDISIVFCGDFNSVPQSGIFKLMTQQFVEEDFIDFQSNLSEADKGVSLSQPFALKSSYEPNPKYTNYTLLFAACIDYIFYQTSNVRVTQTIPLPHEEDIKAHSAIPSVIYPSDHMALVADFEWLQ